MEQHRKLVLEAINYLMGVIPPMQKISDIRLEEIYTLPKDAIDVYNIVLSYDTETTFAFDKKREYKLFKVSDMGGALSMRNFDKNA